MAFCRTIISVSRTFNFLSCFTQNGTNKTRRLFKCISNFHFHLLTHFYHFVFLPCESFMHSVIKCEKYNHWHSSKCSSIQNTENIVLEKIYQTIFFCCFLLLRSVYHMRVYAICRQHFIQCRTTTEYMDLSFRK